MEVIFEQYQERLIRLQRARATLVCYRQSIAAVESALSAMGKTALTVEPVEMEEIFAAMRYAPATKQQYLTNVRAAYRYAQRRGLAATDPTYDVQIERVPDKEPVVIPNGELRTIKASIGCGKLWLLFHLLVYTGMRRFEIHNLLWEDVNLVRSTIRVMGKGGKLRYVPIHPALGEVLADERYHLTRPVCRAAHWRSAKKLSPVYGYHAYRRSVASSLAYNAVPERIIDRIMGWAPRTVRDRYYVAVADDELQRGILRLYQDDPI